jgi:DME family drug/metabolite transporter
MRERLRRPLPSLRRAAPAGDSHTWGLLAVAAAALLWAAAAAVARSLFDDGVEPLELVQARAYLTLAGLSLLRPWRRAPKGEVSPWVVMALGLAIALVNATYYIAIERLPVAVALVIQHTAPALVVTYLALGRRRMPSPEILVALVIAIAGVALAAEVGSGDLGSVDAVGVAAASASAVLFATYTLLSERTERAFGAVGAMFRAFIWATAFWVLFQSSQGWPSVLLEPDNLLRVLFVGIGGTLAPFLLYVWGLPRVQAERAVIAASLEPPAGAVMAWIWLGQVLSGLQVLGGLLVLGAVATLQLRRRRVLPPEHP